MQIEFDIAKDAANQDKHNASLAYGAEILADPNRLDILDVRFDYARGAVYLLRCRRGSRLGLRFHHAGQRVPHHQREEGQ